MLTYNDILMEAKKICSIDDDCDEKILNSFEKIVQNCILEMLIKYPSFCVFNVIDQTYHLITTNFLMHFITADWYLSRGWKEAGIRELNSAHVALRKLKRKLDHYVD